MCQPQGYKYFKTYFFRRLFLLFMIWLAHYILSQNSKHSHCLLFSLFLLLFFTLRLTWVSEWSSLGKTPRVGLCVGHQGTDTSAKFKSVLHPQLSKFLLKQISDVSGELWTKWLTRYLKHWSRERTVCMGQSRTHQRAVVTLQLRVPRRTRWIAYKLNGSLLWNS